MPILFDDDDDEDDFDDEETSDPGTSVDLDEIEDAILNGEEIEIIDEETGDFFPVNESEETD